MKSTQEDEQHIEQVAETSVVTAKKKRVPPPLLERFYDATSNKYELCIDEVGRGCLFGRAYIACVVLPKDPTAFDGKDIKDSKKFSSKKKLQAVAEYIKEKALCWHISYIEANVIDEINILHAVMRGMHDCIKHVLDKLDRGGTNVLNSSMAVIDGNYFTPYRCFDETSQSIYELPHTTIEQGDGKYMGIAAASILAKTARDAYVSDLCAQYPVLSDRYGLHTNMGYGTKTHLDGIREYGITQWHRRTFGELCKGSSVTIVE
jgi:ribonuclease HII